MDRQIGLSYTASITINISYRISGLQAESLALTWRDGLPVHTREVAINTPPLSYQIRTAFSL